MSCPKPFQTSLLPFSDLWRREAVSENNPSNSYPTQGVEDAKQRTYKLLVGLKD